MSKYEMVKNALDQWEEGAITYVEFVRYAASKVDEDDVKEINNFAPEQFAAQWPFKG